MLDTGSLRDLLARTDKVKSEHLVIAEWNMNRYQKIDNFGLYLGVATQFTYSASDTTIVDGSNYIIYDDDYVEEDIEEKIFSNLGSAFEPDRPDPGIVLLLNGKNSMVSRSPRTEMSSTALSSGSARFYPFMENRPYDYFNSAKNLAASSTFTGGVSDLNGLIESANPFVVYESVFPCNKIVIKVQNHLSIPTHFNIDVLRSSAPTTWTTVFSEADDNSTLFATGKLELYYSSNAWSTTVSRVSDLTQIYQGGSNDQVDEIIGIRLRVTKMTIPTRTSGRKYNSSLELIEMSPRLEVDMSDYTESFSYNSSIGESEFGLPVGSLVTSTGDISLSNETNAFISASALPKFGMLNPNVEFRFYQKITASVSGDDASTSLYTVPLKTMYAESWTNSDNYSTAVSLSDRFRLFQEKNVPDLAFMTKRGIPFSSIILMILDNCGVTGYEFKKTNNDTDADSKEDTRITNFFCDKDQTLMEVLESIAIATQSCMYIDSSNNLSVMTKERVAGLRDLSYSSSALNTTGTDFWFVGDEDFSGTGVQSGTTASYVSSSYVANIVSFNESKLLPVTDGDINYHVYGFRKVSGGTNLLTETIPNQYLEDVPAISVVLGSGYSYQGTQLWSPGSDSTGVLGAANLIASMNTNRLKNVYANPIVATSKENAIRGMYASATVASALNALVISLDRNEIYTIPDYQGYVLVDGEFIEYYGKAFLAGNSRGYFKKVFFSDEDMSNYINASANMRSALVPVGLIVKPEFSVTEKSNGSYSYRVIDDGRGALGSRIVGHDRVLNNEDSDITASNRFSIAIGNTRSDNRKVKPQLSATLKYDFSQIRGFSNLKKRLNVPTQNYQTYLGHLKISGPKALPRDSKAFSASTASVQIGMLNQNNIKVDKLVPGSGSLSFDDFVFFLGERFIHGQKIPLRFPPNIVSTRMRLFSGRRTINGQNNVASTLSSIAGLAFDVTSDGSGYYLEVESIASGKDSVSPRAVNRNLRFYKLFYRNGRMNVEILFTGAVNVQSVINRDIQLTTDRNVPTDPVFELTVMINRKDGAAQYDIYYGDKKVNSTPIVDVRYNSAGKRVIDQNQRIEKNVVLFVRNDSQAIYEYVAAVGLPHGKSTKPNQEQNYGAFDSELNTALSGTIAINKWNQFSTGEKDTRKIYYFNDFAKVVRQVKKYDIRYINGPARLARLIDVSRVNPQYAIKSQKYTPFGAEIVVMNTSPGAIALSEEVGLPLYIYGICLEELSNGSISMDSLYDKTIDYKKKTVDISFNRSRSGEKSFSLDSVFIQSPDTARSLMRWVVDNCSHERAMVEMEVFPNPIIELGDKVKILAKDRGYYPSNESHGDKTFIVSDISYSVSSEGPSMTIKAIEVGEI